jgi:pimeloyl-[acyl-carrier protein] methyl ester esterase
MVAPNLKESQVTQAKIKLVLTHGWGMNSQVWDLAWPLLEASFDAQALDLPGHGRNAEQVPGATLEQWAYTLLGQANSPAVWVGWSLGGLAALAAARKSPEKIRALVLVASTPKFVQGPDWPHAITPEVLYKFEENLRSDYHQLLEDFIVMQSMGTSKLREEVRLLRGYLKEGGEPSPQALSLGLAFLLQTDLRAALRELRCPCLLLLGDRDKLVPAALAEVFRREYPQIEVQVIKGCGHAPFLSHYVEFADALNVWIKKITAKNPHS